MREAEDIAESVTRQGLVKTEITANVEVISLVHELAKAVQLLVFTICKSSVLAITKPNLCVWCLRRASIFNKMLRNNWGQVLILQHMSSSFKRSLYTLLVLLCSVLRNVLPALIMSADYNIYCHKSLYLKNSAISSMQERFLPDQIHRIIILIS